MSDRLSVATACLSGCSGCHVAFLDIGEPLEELAGVLDVVYSPLVDAKKIPPTVDVAVVEGAVSTERDVEVLQALRNAAAVLVALGTCATHGGITALRGLVAGDGIAAPATGAAEDGSGRTRLMASVRPVAEVVEVDHSILGCPPRPETLLGALVSIKEGRPVASPSHNLCEECHRKKVRMLVAMREFITDNVYAPFELEDIDEELCFLEQGVICMGPMTREGCGASCMRVNVPCRGCWGPAVREMDQAAKTIDALAPILPAGAMMFLDDLPGIGYRYSLATSILSRSRPPVAATGQEPGDG